MKRRHIEHVNPRRMIAKVKQNSHPHRTCASSSNKGNVHRQQSIVDKDAIGELKSFMNKCNNDQSKMDKLFQMFTSVSMQNPQVIRTSHVGTTKGIVDAAMRAQPANRDEVQELVDDIVDVSVGYLPDTGFGQDTIEAARTFASQENTNWIATAIQGTTARELA